MTIPENGGQPLPTVLIIDDDAAMRRLLVRALTRAGYHVEEAQNGREGLENFRRSGAAAVITDIVMPEQDGIETIRQIRAIAPTTPIIAISSGGGRQDLVYLTAAGALGATEMLAKPFRPADLVAALARVLRPK